MAKIYAAFSLCLMLMIYSAEIVAANLLEVFNVDSFRESNSSL